MNMHIGARECGVSLVFWQQVESVAESRTRFYFLKRFVQLVSQRFWPLQGMLHCAMCFMQLVSRRIARQVARNIARCNSALCHFCSYHILTSSVIWTDARQHGIYLLYIIKKHFGFRLVALYWDCSSLSHFLKETFFYYYYYYYFLLFGFGICPQPRQHFFLRFYVFV